MENCKYLRSDDEEHDDYKLVVNLRSEFEAKDKVGKWVYGEVTGWNRRVLKSCASIIFLKLCFLIEGLFCIWFSA